jgi:adenylate cyclase
MAKRALTGLLHQCELEPENARAHYLAAGLLQRLGRGDEGRDFAEKALRLRPDDFSTIYNVACYYSLAGDSEHALDLLERGMRQGGGSFDWMRHDSDLANLHALPRFQQLLADLRDRPSPEQRAADDVSPTAPAG